MRKLSFKKIGFVVCLLPGLVGCGAEVETKKVVSPFPLPPVPQLTNSQSARPEFGATDSAIAGFLNKWELKGVSVAIARRGKLIYAKGFGYADQEHKIALEPSHVLRIASASKLITAAAIMKLVEEGKLALTDTVFGKRGILNDSIFLHIKDRRATQITVRNLLDHSSGWTIRYGDPAFMAQRIAQERKVPMPVSVDDIICFVLSKNMHFPTGERSSYVNVGYIILGRIIEKITSMPYENYVQSTLLAPMGIGNMCLGNGNPRDFYANEVMYYDSDRAKPVAAFDNPQQMVAVPQGGRDIHTLGAAGGWVASPAEFLRFVLCLDGKPEVPDILPQHLIDTMVTPAENHDPIGWRRITPQAWIRTGTLAGTSSVVARDSADFCWAFVTNTSAWKGANFSSHIYFLMKNIVEQQAHKWTDDYDLYCEIDDEKTSH